MNEVLEDIIVRSQSLLGKDATYVPGWDCHGLPIEWKIEEEYRTKRQNKNEISGQEFRAEWRPSTDSGVGGRKEQFSRMCGLGAWNDTNLTRKCEQDATSPKTRREGHEGTEMSG